MLETYLSSPVACARLRAGAAADRIDAFADWLHCAGYTQLSIKSMLVSLAGWTDWMRTAGYAAQDLLTGLEACRAMLARQERVPRRGGPNKQSLAAAGVFVRFLRERGDIPFAAPASRPSERWPLLGELRSWMRTHRGLTESSLDVYEGILAGLLDALGDDPSVYTAESLRAFVLERAKPHGIERAKSIAVAVRAFLRFLGATGRCAPGMDGAIPGYACWQSSATPRYLPLEDIERLIQSCADDAHGLRDRAVLLLLARLALRASDVAELRFPDIDWRNGTILVCGKARRQALLPLPQEVGDAILRYLERGRPPLAVPEVFVTFRAPLHPLTRAAVTQIVRSALRRCGIRAPINGAHVLRHSAATAMLRQGASLAGVGAVLRHRSARTTTIYAKVDFDLLSGIAQPWPEVAPC
jgi:integrase/recombinase XerD